MAFKPTLQALVPWTAALVFVSLAQSNGIPALRHDWLWPAQRADFYDYLIRATSAWDPQAIGSQNFFIQGYMIALPIVAVGYLLGPQTVLALFLAAIALLTTMGASALARSLGAGASGCAAAALVALFNPWCYNELVAGHTYMLLAYGACLALLAEALRPQMRSLVAALCVILTLQQLQFFVFALLFVFGLGIVRKSWLPLLSGVLVGLPAFIGLLFATHSLEHVPFTLAWEQTQSVAPADAIALGGYFANYSGVMPAAHWIMLLVLAIAALGVLSRPLSRGSIMLIAVGIAATVAAMGLRGPLAPLERFAIVTWPASALFRELYDLLGLTALCYVCGLAIASKTFRLVGPLASLCGVALTLAWLQNNPAHWWLPAQSLPKLSIHARADTRYALSPVFQPLRFHDKGAGIDPDAQVLPRNVVALNQPYPAWPVDAFLAAYLKSNDARPLGRLSTSLLVRRPWYRSDLNILAFQRALSPLEREAPGGPMTVAVAAQPEIALLPMPKLGTLANRVGDGAVFFGDAAAVDDPLAPPSWKTLQPITAVNVSNEYVRAQYGWVDARLAFAVYPELAQGLGGAITASRDALLRVTPGLTTLVFVRGTLTDPAGNAITHTTAGYRWLGLPLGVNALRCLGLCVVAAQGQPPPSLPLNPPPLPLQAISGRWWLPWLISLEVPPGRESFLRLNVRYDPHWQARIGGRTLVHVRVDTAVNGWILPPRGNNEAVTLVNDLAAVQAGLEVAGVIWTGALLLLFAGPMKRTLLRHKQRKA